MNPILTRRQLLAGAAGAAAAWALDGLALRPAAQRGRVAVVGAGLAGLAAAFELTAAGHEVAVFEARTRPGGRVRTLRAAFADGLYAEAGAMQLPESHDLSLHYARLLELPLVPLPAPGDRSLAHLGGRRLVWARGEEPPWPFALSDEERRLGLGGMSERYWGPELAAAVAAHGAADWPPAELRPLDALTAADHWRRHGASEAAVAALRLSPASMLGDGPERVSALALVREAAHRRAGEARYRVDGGMDLLPAAFAARLGARVRYGSPVVALRQDAARVRVVVQTAAGVREHEAERCVCAIPFPLLREIDVDPPLPGAVRDVVEGLRLTSVTRTYLQCRSRPWEGEGVSGYALTDLPIRLLFETANGRTGPRAILESYASGEPARQLAALAPAARLAAVVEQASRVHPGLAAEVEGGESVVWDDEPWARGGYAWFAPGELLRWLPHLTAPVGRLHFAGDHTSLTPGWMQGAFASARRAAAEVDAALRLG